MKKCNETTPHEITWIPILWAMKLLTRARNEGKIKIEAPVFANLISSFKDIETANRKVLNYGWVNFPLAYTQVATFSVFLYFFAALFGRQYLIPDHENGSHRMATNLFQNLTIPFVVDGPFKGPLILLCWIHSVECPTNLECMLVCSHLKLIWFPNFGIFLRKDLQMALFFI